MRMWLYVHVDVIICEGVYVYSCMCVHECVSEIE